MTVYDEDEKRSMAARSLTPFERVERGDAGDPPRESYDEVELRGTLAATYAAAGLGLDDRRETLPPPYGAEREAFGAFGWPADEPVPEWVESIGRLVAYCERSTVGVDDVDAQLRPELSGGVPFAHLLVPVARFAAEPVDLPAVEPDPVVRPDLLRFSHGGVNPFEEWLVRRLSRFSAQALHLEFRLFKRDAGGAAGDASTALYEQFLGELLAGGLADLFYTYPVLGRVVATLVGHWRRAVGEFVRRLAADVDEIRTAFGIREGAGVVDVLPGAGDSHGRGRTVVGLRFEGGGRCYYKPRDLTPEQFFASTVDRLNRRADGVPDLRVPDVLAKDGYGWVNHVERRPTAAGSVATYYERFGALLALAYVVCATDLHFENVVASGDRPVVVDYETILTRNLLADVVDDSMPEKRLVATEADRSVVRLLLLPLRSSLGEESADDVPTISGGGRIEAVESATDTIRWTDVNTDAMDFEFGPGTFEPSANYPVVDGTPVPPSEHPEAVVEGFAAAYEHLRREPGTVLETDAGTDVDAIPTRYLLRITEEYEAALDALAKPRSLRDGLYAGLELEKLLPATVGLFDDASVRRLWPLFRAEQTALLAGDVPRFVVRGTDIAFRDRVLVADLFERSHGELLETTLDGLSSSDRDRQLGYVRAALHAAGRRTGGGPSGG